MCFYLGLKLGEVADLKLKRFLWVCDVGYAVSL